MTKNFKKISRKGKINIEKTGKDKNFRKTLIENKQKPSKKFRKKIYEIFYLLTSKKYIISRKAGRKLRENFGKQAILNNRANATFFEQSKK